MAIKQRQTDTRENGLRAQLSPRPKRKTAPEAENDPEPLNLRRLLSFVQIAESGGFAEAASVLGTNLVSLGRHVTFLEGQLRAKLFIRQDDGVRLTNAGAHLLKHSREILDHVRRAHTEIQHIVENPGASTILGMAPTAAVVMANPVALRFLEELPNARLRVVHGFSAHLREWLAVGRIDVALLYNSTARHGEKLWVEDLFLIGHLDPASSDCGKYEFKRLPEIPLILPSQPHGLRQLLERTAARSGIDLNVVVEVDSLATILDLVEKGLGFTILPLVALHDRIGNLRHAKIIEPQVSRTLLLATSTHKPLSQTARALLHIIRREADAIKAAPLLAPEPTNAPSRKPVSATRNTSYWRRAESSAKK